MVELPSNPQLGISARVGGWSNAFSRLFPRSSGTGFLPSSQMYSSLYFVISISRISLNKGLKIKFPGQSQADVKRDPGTDNLSRESPAVQSKLSFHWFSFCD